MKAKPFTITEVGALLGVQNSLAETRIPTMWSAPSAGTNGGNAILW